MKGLFWLTVDFSVHSQLDLRQDGIAQEKQSVVGETESSNQIKKAAAVCLPSFPFHCIQAINLLGPPHTSMSLPLSKPRTLLSPELNYHTPLILVSYILYPATSDKPYL